MLYQREGSHERGFSIDKKIFNFCIVSDGSESDIMDESDDIENLFDNIDEPQDL